MTSFDDGVGAGPASGPAIPTVPFIPSTVEMLVLQQIDSGESRLPALPELPGEPAEAQVRAARASLAGAVRRYAVPALRALRRGETVACVGTTAASVLAATAPHVCLAGLTHNTGALWLLGLADRLAEPARLEEVLALLNRYQGAATVQIAERWRLPAEVVQACRDPGPRAARHLVARLVQVGVLLAPAVEARLDGGSAEWSAAALGELGVGAPLAERIVRDTVSALT